MVWQEAFPPNSGPAFDADAERERRLATQARAGAEWALTALIARYQPTVVRYLTRLCGNQAHAQNLAARIFQRMERRLHGPHGADNLRLWLLRSCTEAGLDALRRPSAATPRLGGASVAGLLTEQSSAQSPGLLRHKLRRLHKGPGSPERQSRPLIWADNQVSGASGGPGQSSAGSHVDEELDRLDPRDALRHRLTRVTLAELPFGDAQCLALHLVAGLNQAEVARALGITNSAARKRIVHGLALFSDHYSEAVRTLGLPVELGYGDALPRAPIEPEPAAELPPEPVIVSAQASEQMEDMTADDDMIVVTPQADRGADALSSHAYLSEDSDELAVVQLQDDAPDLHAPYTEPSIELAARPTPLVSISDSALDETEQALFSEQDPAPMSGGMITRVASDAILGPIVDALPVVPSSSDLPETAVLPGPRSMPLIYELSSHESPDSATDSDIHLRWLDDSGLMTPLTFEAMAVPATVAVTTSSEDAPLAYEATASTTNVDHTPEEALPAEEDPLALELAQLTMGDERDTTSLADLASPVGAPAPGEDDAPLALVAEPELPAPIIVPVVTPVATSTYGALQSESATDSAPDQLDTGELIDFAPRAAGGVISRSLEDIWNELSDNFDL